LGKLTKKVYNLICPTAHGVCVHAWSPYLVKVIECFGESSAEGTKMVSGLDDMSYETVEGSGTAFTYEQRRLRGDWGSHRGLQDFE